MANKGFRRRIILAAALGILAAVSVFLFSCRKNRMREKEKEFSGAAKSYMNLSSDDGLTVCVWQLEGEPVLSGLFPGKYRYWSEANTQESVEMGLRAGVTLEEMKRILATYDIKKDKISVVEWNNPLSSKAYRYLGEQLTEIREMLLEEK